MLIIGSEGTSMERFTDTITSRTRDGDMSKPSPSISITVPKLMLVRVQLVKNQQKQLESF